VVDSILNFFLPDEYSLLTCVAVTNDNKYFTAGFEMEQSNSEIQTIILKNILLKDILKLF
jgi:hypothetical protein